MSRLFVFQHVWWPAPACGHEWPLFPTTRAGVEIYRKHPPSGREWLLFPNGRGWPLVSGGRKWPLMSSAASGRFCRVAASGRFFLFQFPPPKQTLRESSLLFARALNIFKHDFVGFLGFESPALWHRSENSRSERSLL